LAALGLAQLQGRTQLPEALASRCISALQQPLPRVELGQALLHGKLACAAIDVSDGLLADLGHIAERSSVDGEVFLTQLPSLPAGAEPLLARHCQLAGGDDYELIFTASPGKRHELAALAVRLDLPLWRIGRMVDGQGKVRLLDENGAVLPVTRKGFDHFAQDIQ
jgi:thiamine-monophosphate kinase